MAQDLLHVAFACKSTRDIVSTKMVVKSALFHGGHARKTIEELHALMSNHSMHVPSPLRLLRLVNGRVCEFCRRHKVNHVRSGMGVFSCWDCVSNLRGDVTRSALTRTWETVGCVRYANNQEGCNAILGHRRVASSQYRSTYFLWSEHRTDERGERVGPIVAWDDVDRICNYFRSVNEVMDGGWIDEYLVTNLNAPSIESYDEFNAAFMDAQQRINVTPNPKVAARRWWRLDGDTRAIDESRAIEPTDDDVLFGRGRHTNIHPGNIRFRERALELRSWYESFSKEEKYHVSNVLIESVKGEGHRFLERGSDGLWHEVNGSRARKKASQALRERPWGFNA